MIKLLVLSGSPVDGSSTEILLGEIASSFADEIGCEKVTRIDIRLNDLTFIPCQACGEAPTPEFCFFVDDLTPVYRDIADCHCLLLGSPIYFDSVSAQTKAFMDRCNCLRPADFHHTDPDHDFIKLLPRKRPGAMVLVGGEEGWFEGARRTIAGFFKWAEITNEGVLKFHSRDFNETGEATESNEALREAREMGRRLAQRVEENNG